MGFEPDAVSSELLNLKNLSAKSKAGRMAISGIQTLLLRPRRAIINRMMLMASIGMKYNPKNKGAENLDGSIYEEIYDRKRHRAATVRTNLNVIPNSSGILLFFLEAVISSSICSFLSDGLSVTQPTRTVCFSSSRQVSGLLRISYPQDGRSGLYRLWCQICRSRVL